MAEPDFSLLNALTRKALLAGQGGGSDDGGMLEQRVANLEADMREVKTILTRMEPLLRGIDDKVQRLDKRMDSLERRGEALDDRLRKVEIATAETAARSAQLPTAWTLLTGGIGLILATFSFVFLVLRFALRT